MKAPAFQPQWHNALISDKERGYAHRVDIRADAQQVWRALTETEQLTRWCSPDAEIRARKGGLFRASVDRVTEFEAHIELFEPGRRLRLIYLPAPALPPADTVMLDDFMLDPVPLRSVVRRFGSGGPPTVDRATRYRPL